MGARHILHSPVSGTILTTDDLGLAILSDPTRPAADLPRGVVDEILGTWRDAGLFDAMPPPFPDPVADDGRAAPHRRVHTGAWGAISVETDDPVLARQLDDILGGLAASQTPAAPAVRLRCVTCAGGELGLFRDGRALWGRASRDVARYMILREAAEALCGTQRVGAILHGAAVGAGGRALLILGDSGQGKSTLAQGLVDAGCGFLADDHLPLATDGRHLLAFPTGSAVKQGARDLDEVRRLVARHGGPHGSRDGIRYLRLDPGAALGSALPLVAVVFPDHAPGAATRITRMGGESAFIAAIASGSRPSRHLARIAPLARLFAAVPTYALRYGTSDQSVPACLDLLAA